MKTFNHQTPLDRYLCDHLGEDDVSIDIAYWSDPEDAACDLVSSVLLAARHQAGRTMLLERVTKIAAMKALGRGEQC